jgi:hypothetical protein
VAVIKARNVAPGVTSLHCPPAVNDALRDSPALWDQDSKSWLVQTNDLPQVTSWLEGQGHAVLLASAFTTTTSKWSSDQVAPRADPEVTERGAAAARKALHRAQLAAGDEASRDSCQQLAAELCEVRTDWELVEVTTVLLHLARTRGPWRARRMREKTLDLARTVKTPWGLLAAGNPPLAGLPTQPPGPSADDHPAAAALPSADQAPAADQVDEPW